MSFPVFSQVIVPSEPCVKLSSPLIFVISVKRVLSLIAPEASVPVIVTLAFLLVTLPAASVSIKISSCFSAGAALFSAANVTSDASKDAASIRQPPRLTTFFIFTVLLLFLLLCKFSYSYL